MKSHHYFHVEHQTILRWVFWLYLFGRHIGIDSAGLKHIINCMSQSNTL